MSVGHLIHLVGYSDDYWNVQELLSPLGKRSSDTILH